MKFIIFWRYKTPGWGWSITKLITSEFFIKWTQFYIKSTKIGVFYRYGYTDITTFRDPCFQTKYLVMKYAPHVAGLLTVSLCGENGEVVNIAI